MDWAQVLRLWEWRPEVLIPLAVLGGLYTRGWLRLRARARRRTASRARLAAYWAGLLFLLLALVSPLAPLSDWLLSVHMVQHMLLIMFAPPLIWLANPMPVMLWALPPRLRQQWGFGLFGPRARFRATVRALTGRKIAWLLFVLIYIGWHDQTLYNAALGWVPLHDVQHLTFTGSAMLYWWHVTNAGPRLHGRFSFGSRLVYLLSIVPVNVVTGLAIAFGRHVYYEHYSSVPRYFGLSVLDDQRLAGMIMWIFGSMMLIYAAVIFIFRHMALEQRKAKARPPGAHHGYAWGDETPA